MQTLSKALAWGGVGEGVQSTHSPFGKRGAGSALDVDSDELPEHHHFLD